MSQDSSYPEKKEKGELATARSPDDWYMRVYDLAGPGTGTGVWFRRWRWRKIAVAGGLGVCLGLGAAAWRPSNASAVQDTYKTAPLNSKSIPVSEDIRSALPPAGPSRPIAPATAAGKAVSTLLTGGAASEEVERLQTRNRRLEALVEVLRQRAVDKRTIQEPASYLGQ